MSGKNKVENMAQKARGKAEETTGKAVGNERLTAKGKIDQAAADAKQAGEKAKDALKH
ncbi:CsbD family protein [Kitasatospora sp. NPDC085879]|uniref:CsbD family protein n=1 Tax=Kitasatospora sp. NPDC085879 TaxID=3154769 RepID=UPI000BB158EC|nr:CsbD family protein [Streptomyces sp. TLI_235]PBC76023.1 CsbD-like protein [Streptomyces sp. TLI_235]